VALARALICTPRLILLDEPLAALDVELRRQMQIFLKNVQREVKTTFLFVTHDQEEAIAMADRICVMNSGRILQLGTPHDVYYRPRSEFVARFFGDNNLIEGRLVDGTGAHRRIETPAGVLVCAVDGQSDLADAAPGRQAFAVFRPESVTVGEPSDGADNACRGIVSAVNFAGATTMAEIHLVDSPAPVTIRAKMASRIEGAMLAPGQTVSIAWSAAACRLVLR
jgi:spermidine/putrescine transport system ATP-binding protein